MEPNALARVCATFVVVVVVIKPNEPNRAHIEIQRNKKTHTPQQQNEKKQIEIEIVETNHTRQIHAHIRIREIKRRWERFYISTVQILFTFSFMFSRCVCHAPRNPATLIGGRINVNRAGIGGLCATSGSLSASFFFGTPATACVRLWTRQRCTGASGWCC